MQITLRDYQIDCVNKANEALQYHDRALVVMATGLGKTTVAAEIVKHVSGRSLFVAHRRELIFQAHKRLLDHTGKPVGIEMGSRRSNREPVIVGSVQSMISRDVPSPDLIIIDEAHHAVSPTYRKFLDKFPNAKVLGVTATPDRSDKIGLGALFQTVAYRYETPQAIRDGWLAPIFRQRVYGVGGLLGAVGNRKTVLFTPTVKEAVSVAEQLPNATFVHGELPGTVRDARLRDFKEGKYQFVTNCNILTEGFDAPDIGCVAMMRATESRAVFVQCLGRGLRLAPGKSNCLYIDMVDMPEHDLEGPRNALGGKVTPPEWLPKNSWWRKLFV